MMLNSHNWYYIYKYLNHRDPQGFTNAFDIIGAQLVATFKRLRMNVKWQKKIFSV